MLAHSLRLVLPRMTAPAARSRRTRNASRTAGAPDNAREPALVHIRSPVAMLSLSKTGIPSSRPVPSGRCRFASLSAASRSASGLRSITARSAGPRRSSPSMRCRQARTKSVEVVAPEAKREEASSKSGASRSAPVPGACVSARAWAKRSEPTAAAPISPMVARRSTRNFMSSPLRRR